MAPGRRRTERQQELWVATSQQPASTGHVYYDALNGALRDAKFDNFLSRCAGRFTKKGSSWKYFRGQG